VASNNHADDLSSDDSNVQPPAQASDSFHQSNHKTGSCRKMHPLLPQDWSDVPIRYHPTMQPQLHTKDSSSSLAGDAPDSSNNPKHCYFPCVSVLLPFQHNIELHTQLIHSHYTNGILKNQYHSTINFIG
jgi:hypothetical protein